MTFEGLDKTFCIESNSNYYDRIVFTLEYILSTQIDDLEITASQNSVLTLMNRSDRRRTNRNRLDKTKKTEFKYFFRIGNDYSNDDIPVYYIKFKNINFVVSIFKLFTEPQVSDGCPNFPQQLKIEYNNLSDIKTILDYSNKIN